jgi:hypothetical protein
MSDLRRRNGWRIAERAGDRTPDRTQRLLNRAVWDTFAAMGVVRRFAVAGLDEAARQTGRPRGLAVGAIDETGQVKAGELTAGVKRQYLGCAGKVANGINTAHLAYVRESTGHALIGAREWIPAAHIDDPVKSAVMGLPDGLTFRTKGQLAIDILAGAFADLPPRLGQRGHADLRPGRRPAGPPRVGGPLGRDRIQRATLVRLGVAGHRRAQAPPADPPPPAQQRAGLSLLLPARRPAGLPVPADPRRRAALAGRRRFRIRQGLLRARPVPGPPLRRHRPAHRAGHGRPGHLRRHRRPAPPVRAGSWAVNTATALMAYVASSRS